MKQEEETSSDKLLTIARDKTSTSAMLTEVVENTDPSIVLLAVVNHDACTLEILETILKDKKNIGSKVLEAIIKRDICTPKILLAVVNHSECTFGVLRTIFSEMELKEKINSDVLRAIVKLDICTSDVLSEVVEHPRLTEFILTNGVLTHKNCTREIIRDILDSDPDEISHPCQIINSSVLEGIANWRHLSISDIRKITRGSFRSKITQEVVNKVKHNPSIGEERRDGDPYDEYPINMAFLEQALDENKKKKKLERC